MTELVRSARTQAPTAKGRARLVVALAAASLASVLVLVAEGCSSTPAETTGCDSSKCAAGNTCIDVGGEVKCRKTCTSNVDATKACPFGYTCTARANQEAVCTGDQCYCAENAASAKVQKADKGQWGATCKTTGGIAANPDCDAAQAFQCYAKNPADANAYCTRACTQDADCAGGFFCGEVNDSPSAEAAKRTGTGTIKICQKRDYCSPCKSAVDCAAGQICAGAGSAGAFCTSACTSDTTCTVDSFCSDYAGGKYCFPNAGTCVGDGKLCSPCRSDSDCKAGGGICASSSYTTERFCTQPSASKCASSDCPAAPEGVAGVGCAKEAFDDVPGGSCVGLFKLKKSDIPGCYTRARK
ncbi:MAG: hypothetical protein IPK71_28940 [Myxococcales bacterium]|nr:hypothetical protein [Myxococcales bacterium]